MAHRKDQLYSDIDAKVGSFKFDGRVAEVFNDMISRSVPGYRQILELIPTLTRQFQFENHNYYDLGCSTGAGMLAMSEGLGDTTARIIGIDNSAAMLQQASTEFATLALPASQQIEFHHADINETLCRNAAMTLLNFTLQFIAIEQRDRLIERIGQNTVPGGVLVLSEKLQSDDSAKQSLMTKIHHQYKADQGYSLLEISKKRDAIENVLIPETLETHIKRLQQAGFNTVTPWIRNLQFVSILAVK